eukprot:TRINITY_DN6982_c0_g1_i1.p1 TRINITY_DN6982_c0_g1~~TRINITY_DN6982_c0_g1_i1.p1  ORF type:complete len:328 (-),score=55.68 TRINITY_DN6982_c0_g1_i1:304-1287(-)
MARKHPLALTVLAMAMVVHGALAAHPPREQPEIQNPRAIQLTVGTPGVSFHQVANWVVVRGLERLGYNVTVVDSLPHRDMYPMFTGSNGEHPSIDIVTGSDLPYNHLPYLGPTKYDPSVNPPWHAPPNWRPSAWRVIGTVIQTVEIVVAAPTAAIVSSVANLTTVPESFSRDIIGLDENTCPACVKNGNYLTQALGGAWHYKQHNGTAFVAAIEQKISAGETEFVAVWYQPTYLNGVVGGKLRQLDGTSPWPTDTVNQGKIIIRNDRISKLTAEARGFLGSMFLTNKDVVEMDGWALQGSPEQAAARWIRENPHVFAMNMGQFNITA